jgi:uncharacterized alkaline shock family protein YloU
MEQTPTPDEEPPRPVDEKENTPVPSDKPGCADEDVADKDTSLAEDEYAEGPAAEQPRTVEALPQVPKAAWKPPPRKKSNHILIEQEMGSLEMSDEVIATIVHEECRAQGVLEVGGKGLAKKLRKVFAPGRTVDGVYIEQRGRSLLLEVTITVQYGIDIPALADDVRTRIAEKIENITGCRARAVNIVVDRIVMPKQPPK